MDWKTKTIRWKLRIAVELLSAGHTALFTMFFSSSDILNMVLNLDITPRFGVLDILRYQSSLQAMLDQRPHDNNCWSFFCSKAQKSKALTISASLDVSASSRPQCIIDGWMFSCISKDVSTMFKHMIHWMKHSSELGNQFILLKDVSFALCLLSPSPSAGCSCLPMLIRLPK